MIDFYPTADDKRKMGESVLQLDVRTGMEWLESAAAQEAGTLDAYKAAVREWREQKPRPRDFLPVAVQDELKEREAAELARAEREFLAIWGGLLP